MSEQSAAAVETTQAPAAPKARKASARKAKKPAAKPSGNGMSPQRVTVLRAMAKGDGTLADVVKRSRLAERAAYHHLWHLRKDGLIRSRPFAVDDGARPEVRFELTAKGVKAAKSV